MGSTVQLKRSLTREDLERMRVPVRYWNVRFDQITGKVWTDDGRIELMDVFRRYGEDLSGMVEKGFGLVLWGSNGNGKTSAAACFAKEYRRRGHTVLFMQAAELKRMVIDKERFDEDETYWDRASSVGVLILDDLGKGTMDTTGFGAELIDELIRTRSAKNLVTFITSNVDPREWILKLGLKESTIQTLKECALSVQVEGEDLRDRTKSEFEQQLLSG